MKPRELSALLNLLEKHPRVASLTVGDVQVEFRDASPPEAVFEEADPAPELPDGVIDPRKRLAEIHRKHNVRRAS